MGAVNERGGDMSETIVFRSPRVGDVIRTVEPLKCDAIVARRGDYLRVKILTAQACAEAAKLVAYRRWGVVKNGEPTT